MAESKLTLGPLLFHWDAEKRRDFYFRIADEAPVDCVYLGEVVCSKRAPFFEPYRAAVIERLQKAGKQVVLSSLALMTLPREIEALKEDAKSGLWIEANDVAAIRILKEIGKQKEQTVIPAKAGIQGRKRPKTVLIPLDARLRGHDAGENGFLPPFVVGPTINVLNEGAMETLAGEGAKRIVFASELSGKSLKILAAKNPDIEKEVQVFGRQPLAVSMRCYHARAAGRDKDHCRFACAADPDGMEIETLTGQKILAVNGVQTLSHGYLVLAEEALELQKAGITHFRLSPQEIDMVRVAKLYRDLLEERISPDSLVNSLKSLKESAFFINGFYQGCEGRNPRSVLETILQK